MQGATNQITHNLLRLIPLAALGFSLAMTTTEAIGGREVAPGSAHAGVSLRARTPHWLTFLLQIRAIEDTLNAQNLTPLPSDATQESALEEAQDQQARYASDGIAPNLTDEQLLLGLDAVRDARATILGNPSEFTDPAWDDYLGMLGELKADLEVALSAFRGGGARGEVRENGA
ncbi:MAG: hypothetical protein IT431_18200 [Phycisphaerales bacterium]|nr:hypothetical protein [Phycisphaerales bacterium]